MRKSLLIVFLSIFVLTTSCSNQPESPEKIEPNGVGEKVVTVQTVDIFGVVKAGKTQNVYVSFPSVVDAINAPKGRIVKKGDTIMTLDLSEFRNSIYLKEEELKNAKQEYDKALKSSKIVKEEIRILKEELELKQKNLNQQTDPEIKNAILDIGEAEKAFDNAKIEVDMNEQLLESGSISQSKYDEIKKNMDLMKVNYEKSLVTLDSIKLNKKKEVDLLRQEIKQKEISLLDSGSSQLSRVSHLEGELKLMKNKLSKSYFNENQIVNVFEKGLVYQIGYDEGDIIDTMQKVVSIVDLKSLVIKANVPEEFIADINEGSIAKIVPVADKSREYKGEVTRIYDLAIRESGETNIPIEISIENIDEFLHMDYNVDISINLE